jgi:hypothetical protein
MRHRRLPIIIVCLAIGFCLLSTKLAINHVTASGKHRAIWRASLAGLDVGVDTWPAEPGYGGYIEVWYESQHAEEYQPFLRLPGTPALPVLPPPRPGEVWAWFAPHTAPASYTGRYVGMRERGRGSQQPSAKYSRAQRKRRDTSDRCAVYYLRCAPAT